MTTRIKICGLTRVDDVDRAVDLGADAIGLVFHARSPRHVNLVQAEKLLERIPPFVTRVALFRDAPATSVAQVVQQLSIDALQFHGSETNQFARQFGKRWFKAIGMGDPQLRGEQLATELAAYPDSSGLLFDSHSVRKMGGSGKQFDWSVLPSPMPRGSILAGGLNADNVAQAIQTTQTSAVDVSSGVELAPGVKSAQRMKAFFDEVKRVSE
jgi:phosphoribosylanthranilate isomerase